ncbi:hypothetical protein [Paenibacillus sp. FSL H8-0034]|uniref:hypothetical protein n=1 Tax=Paenibacillus sp. FSL H8-0034 TaxID=2954671 RepID=UPI0030F86DA7
MPKERVYECSVQAGPYQMKIDVITRNPAKVETLALTKAGLYITRAINGQTAATLDMKIVDYVDRGAWKR